MELRNIRSFLYAAGEESITMAAVKLHLSQSTVSKHIKTLESELGRKLFVRHHFQIRLTEEGILLRDKAEDLIRLADQIEREFRQASNPLESILSIGMPENCTQIIILRELLRFCERFPHLKIRMHQDSPAHLRERLSNGTLDLILLPEPPLNPDIEWLLLPQTDRWGILFARGKMLPRKTILTVKDLAGIPLILSDSYSYDRLIAWAGDDMQKISITGSYNSALLAIRSVREGLGAYLLPEHLIEVSPNSGFAFRPLHPPLETRWFLVWRRQTQDKSMPVRFVKQLRKSL